MKIKPVINNEKIIDFTRYNPNTKGTHLLVSEGQLSEEKRDYANIVLVSLMHHRGFLKDSIEETVNASTEYTIDLEHDDVMGL